MSVSPKPVVAQFERVRCMDEEDRLCRCGGRIPYRRCSGEPTVTCHHCGRRYQTSAQLTFNLPLFGELAVLPRKAKP